MKQKKWNEADHFYTFLKVDIFDTWFSQDREILGKK